MGADLKPSGASPSGPSARSAVVHGARSVVALLAMSDPSDPVQQATALFSAGFSCAEAIAAAFADRHGVPRDVALRAAGALGAGMSRTGQTCGAVTGAMLVLGLAHG